METFLSRLVNNEQLTTEEAKTLLLDITKEKYSAVEVAGILTAYAMRGVSVDELIGLRAALLETRTPIDLQQFHAIDIVGTGGDGKNTFNISTCACFVVAGAGYHVAKHGNKGATSVSGASDVLTLHGIKFTNSQDKLQASIDKSGVAYMHAPLFNSGMKFVAPIRKDLHIPTVFNLLGPLINPAQPPFQLLGVANLEQMRLYTQTLTKCGIKFTVVTSLDGYDEASLTGPFKVATNSLEHIYNPADLGLHKANAADLSGGTTPQEASQIFDNVLQDKAQASQKEAVIANAALAIQTICPEKGIDSCVEEARVSLESGQALSRFKTFVELNS